MIIKSIFDVVSILKTKKKIAKYETNMNNFFPFCQNNDNDLSNYDQSTQTNETLPIFSVVLLLLTRNQFTKIFMTIYFPCCQSIQP